MLSDLKRCKEIILNIMMLYLTGADNSLSKSLENPQSDPSKSLGGFVSSSPVPNAAVNSLFDLISSFTLDKRQKETMAIALINKYDFEVKNLELKMVVEENRSCDFKIGAVKISSSNYMMESISSRYQEPILTEFHDASFSKASVDLTISVPANIGEEIALFPFNVNFEAKKSGYDGTWEAFEDAFSEDEIYEAVRISEKVIKIRRRDAKLVETPFSCSYVATESFFASFSGVFKNNLTNSVLLSETLAPNESIGIWIQRIIRKNTYLTDQELFENYKNKVEMPTLEETSLVIDFNVE